MYEIEERAKQNVRDRYPHIVPRLLASSNKYETLKDLLSPSEINKTVTIFYSGRDDEDLSNLELWMRQHDFFIQESAIFALWDKLDVYDDSRFMRDSDLREEFKFVFNLTTEVAEGFIHKHVISKNRTDSFLSALCKDRQRSYEEDWGLFAGVERIFDKENQLTPTYIDCWYVAMYNIYKTTQDEDLKRLFKKYILMSDLA